MNLRSNVNFNEMHGVSRAHIHSIYSLLLEGFSLNIGLMFISMGQCADPMMKIICGIISSYIHRLV